MQNYEEVRKFLKDVPTDIAGRIKEEFFGWPKGTPVVKIEEAVKKVFDCTPAGIIQTLDLKRPIYSATAAYGHFGRSEFPWEKTDKVDALKAAI